MNTEPPNHRRTVARQLWAVPLLVASSAACSQAPAPQVNAAQINSSEGVVVAENSEQRPVANLPFAQGRAFASLDAYLEFRKSRGAYDVPWYREIKPRVYELVSRRGPGTQPETFTREQLAEKFGFSPH